MRARALSSRFVDATLAGFAIWTLCFHLVVHLGGSLAAAGALATAVGAVLVGVWARRRPDSPRAESSRPAVRSAGEDPTERWFGAWLLAAVVVSAIGLVPLSDELKWMILAAYILAAAAVSTTHRGHVLGDGFRTNEKEAEPLVWVVALVGGAMATAMLEPGPDDSATLNFAVVAADHPWSPLMPGDQMLGVPGLPLLFDLYRFEALPAACGAIAWLLGTTAKLVMHRALPFGMGVLSVLAHARLARLLGGPSWKGLFGCMVVLLFATDWSPFSFMRLVHYGKIALFLVMTPLLISYAIEFSARPRLSEWRRLATGQVAALGLSTTAIWAAPLIAGATLLAFWAPTVRATGQLVGGVLASFYVVSVGVVGVVLSLHSTEAMPLLTSRLDDPTFWHDSLAQAARSPALRWASFAAVALSIPLAPFSVARRVILSLALVCVVVLVNPALGPWVASEITGVLTYWRAFLVFPAQLAVGFVVAWPLRHRSGASFLSRRWGVGATTLLLVLLVASSPAGFHWPAIDALDTSPHADGYAVASRVAELADPGEVILAPEEVAQWTTTFQQPPFPLVARRIYLYVLRPHLGEREYARRMMLEAYVAGRRWNRGAGKVLESSIRDDDLGIVVFRSDVAKANRLRRVVRRSGMRLASRVDGYEIWADPGPAALSDSPRLR